MLLKLKEQPLASRSQSKRSLIAPSPFCAKSFFIARYLPFFDTLQEEQLIKLEAQVDWIIEDIRIAFRDDPELINLLTLAGAK